jgi:hypothetical protein
MSLITHSGLYQDDLGQQLVVTQGLSGYTLVDKKQILFRIFLSPILLSRVTSVYARIRYVGADIPQTNILIPYSDLLIENSIPNGPSVGIVLQGNVFPDASLRYSVQFIIFIDDRVLGGMAITHLKFQKSGRLRILAKAVQSITRTAPWGNKIISDIFWLRDINDSMIRFGAMLPVSDGVYFGSNPAPHIGLAYLVGENIDAWPEVCPLGAPPSVPDMEYPNFLVCPASEMRDANLKEAKELNSLGIRIDVTVAWRPRDPMKPPTGEPAGGSAPLDPAPDRRYAGVVGGLQNGFETTASLMAHEVGHSFGCVSGLSPHFDGGWHSKDLDLLDPYAFDFLLLRPYITVPRGPLADVMGQHYGRGKDLTLFSDYDWEHLRQRLVEISALASENLDQSGRKKKLVEEVQTAFVGLQKIHVEDPESTLSSKPGFEWHWTRMGFQRLIEGKPNGNRSGLAWSAESIIFALKQLGIKEVYAPIDGKPLSIVRNNNCSCDLLQ